MAAATSARRHRRYRRRQIITDNVQPIGNRLKCWQIIACRRRLQQTVGSIGIALSESYAIIVIM